jgi:hypothetical protein
MKYVKLSFSGNYGDLILNHGEEAYATEIARNLLGEDFDKNGITVDVIELNDIEFRRLKEWEA